MHHLPREPSMLEIGVRVELDFGESQAPELSRCGRLRLEEGDRLECIRMAGTGASISACLEHFYIKRNQQEVWIVLAVSPEDWESRSVEVRGQLSMMS